MIKRSKILRIALSRQQVNNNFGTITNFIKKMLNYVNGEQKPPQTNIIQHQKYNPPRNQIQAENQFITTEKTVSDLQKGRSARIDQALGTNTYFYDSKLYQERVDSQHIMEITQLYKKYKQPSRKQLNWTNPQTIQPLRVFNKKKYLNIQRSLRKYPNYTNQQANLDDQSNISTIQFLGKQTIYTNLSMKKIEISLKSLDEEQIIQQQEPLKTSKYSYFKPMLMASIYRIQKQKYNSQFVNSTNYFIQNQGDCQQIVNLDFFYETLKFYDLDQRVAQYLKKVENNSIQYLISKLQFDFQQKQVLAIIDLLGTKQQYCAIYYNLAGNNLEIPGKKLNNVIFNLKQRCLIRNHHIYYIQRSQEGGFIQFMEKNTINFEEKLLYKCQSFNQLDISTDKTNSFIFVTESQYFNKYNQKVFIFDQHQKQLIQILPFNKYRYDIMLCAKGLLYAEFQSAKTNYLKYGKALQFCRQIKLIPRKTNKSLMIEDNNNINQKQNIQYLPQTQIKSNIYELDFDKRIVLYSCQQFEFIKEIDSTSSHIIFCLSKFNIFNENMLNFLPTKQSVKSHSLYLEGYQISLSKKYASYDSQLIKFSLQTPLLKTSYKYLIWKKELEEQNLHNLYAETITISENVKIRVLCKRIFLNLKPSVLLYCSSQLQKINEICLEKLLNKGIMFVQVMGRGTLWKDTANFLEGTKDNYINFLQDFQTVLQFVMNELSSNVSLYSKGHYSCLLLFLYTLKYPNIFCSMVFHNGIYDLSNENQLSQLQDYFGQKQQFEHIWKDLNPISFKYMVPDKQPQGLEIGYLKNIVFSSDNKHRYHSRKIIEKLRKNPLIKYEEVFLQEYNQQYETDLNNIAFIYYELKEKK